jgi:adenylate kinase
MIIFILGKPNSGKGTQALMLAEKHKLYHYDSGTNLRAWIEEEDNYLTRKLKATMEKGEFVPIGIAVNL